MAEWTKNKYSASELCTLEKGISISVTPLKKKDEYEINIFGDKSECSFPSIEAAKLKASELIKEKLTRAINNI